MKFIVTIGIPLYNSRDYISHTIQSVLDQSYQEIEILVVDDCSTDGSADVISRVQKSHSNGHKIRVLRQMNNMGVSASRNRIIDEAKGTYLYFLDSDDWIADDDTISRMVEIARKTDSDMVLGSYEKLWLSNGRSEVYQYDYNEFVDDDSFAKFAFRKYGGIQASACNYLVKTELLRSANIRFVDSDYYEDMIFTFDVATCVKRVVTLPEITYYYLFHDGSLSHSQFRDVIPKQEIDKTINCFNLLKKRYFQLLNKPYVSSWIYNILKTDFYILCVIMKNRKRVVPQFQFDEMKSIMSCPLPFIKIMSGDFKFWNLFCYVVSSLPPILCVCVIWCIGKIRGLL